MQRSYTANAWTVQTAIFVLSWTVHAEIISFDLPMPVNKSMSFLYTFYVYSEDDSPGSSSEKPSVNFQAFHPHLQTSQVQMSKDDKYSGAQVGLLQYENLWLLINPAQFCCSKLEVAKGFCHAENTLLVRKPLAEPDKNFGLYVHDLHFDDGKRNGQGVMNIDRTGMYILWLSNCGDMSNGVLSGSISVKNPYGYLPGNQYHKMPFYGCLGILYLVLGIIWLILSIWWWKQLFSIHVCIADVILLSLAESVLWYAFFADWNSTGILARPLFGAAVFCSVVKSAFSYVLILVASLGWGVTQPNLSFSTRIRIFLIWLAYVVCGIIREVVLIYWNYQTFPFWMVLLSILPLSVFNGIIFAWIFLALSSLIKNLEQERQHDKLTVFRRLWFILISSVVAAILSFLCQIYSFSHHSTFWKYEWLFADGVSHIIFLVVLVAIVYLWAPHAHSQRYVYSQQIDNVETDKPNVVIGGISAWMEDGSNDTVVLDNQSAPDSKDAV